ncbi:MAG: C39 family peptidase [Oscillospiraceae bacterium]
MKKLFLSVIAVILAVLVFPVVNASAQTVKSDKLPIELSFNITDCTNGERNGKIEVIISNYNENDSYYVSFNSGKKFYSMEGTSKTLINAENSFYNICVMKNGDRSTLTDIHTVYVGSSEKQYSVKAHFIRAGEKIYKDGKIQAVIDNYDPEKSYVLVMNGGKRVIPLKSNTVDINLLSAGKYNIRIREASSEKLHHTPEFTIDITSAVSGQKKYINADMILQNPELPTGCEITSLAMLLNYIGFNADKEILADNYLEKGKYRASDPYKVFVGDPRSTFAYGCFSDVIAKAAEKYLAKYDKKSEWQVKNMTGCSPENLYAAVDKGHPVIVWATINMKEPKKGAEWVIPETGNKYTWTAGEHCLLLVGYDKIKKTVYLNDPLKGITEYKQSDFEKRFTQMGQHAVIIVKS